MHCIIKTAGLNIHVDLIWICPENLRSLSAIFIFLYVPALLAFLPEMRVLKFSGQKKKSTPHSMKACHCNALNGVWEEPIPVTFPMLLPNLKGLDKSRLELCQTWQFWFVRSGEDLHESFSSVSFHSCCHNSSTVRPLEDPHGPQWEFCSIQLSEFVSNYL